MKYNNYFFLLFCSIFLVTGLILPPPSQAKFTLSEVEQELMCMCQDKCGKMLSNCTCKFADEMRLSISESLKKGLNKERIIDAFVAKYGEKVLSAPTKKGFNLTVWITPFLVLLFGGWGIQRAIRNWVYKGRNSNFRVAAARNLSGGKYKNILENELRNFE